jgi:hypothetical protein
VQDRKLVINETESASVRRIFERFVELGSATMLAKERRREGFLLGVLQAYEALGETELATRKLGDFLTARYGSLADAKVALGDVPAIRQAFLDVQRDLDSVAQIP